MTLCNSNNARDWLCHYGLKLHTIHKPMDLALNTFESSSCFFTTVNEALFPFLFIVFKITIVFSEARTRLFNYFMG